MGCVGAGAGNGTEGAPISSPGRLALRPAQSYRSLCTSQSLHFPLTHYITFFFLLCPPSFPYYGHIIFSLLHFLPLHLRICPSARRQWALSLIRCSHTKKRPLKTRVKKNATSFVREKWNAFHFADIFSETKKCYFTQTSFGKTEANFFADFFPPLFLFLRFSLPHLWAVSVTLFYSAKRNPTKNISSNSHTNKKKCDLTVQEIREVWKGLFLCLKCAIYLSERMHIVSIYTSPFTSPQARGLRS